jgi:hypothetical protein
MSGMASLSSFATGMLRKCLLLGCCMSFLLDHEGLIGPPNPALRLVSASGAAPLCAGSDDRKA